MRTVRLTALLLLLFEISLQAVLRALICFHLGMLCLNALQSELQLPDVTHHGFLDPLKAVLAPVFWKLTLDRVQNSLGVVLNAHSCCCLVELGLPVPLIVLLVLLCPSLGGLQPDLLNPPFYIGAVLFFIGEFFQQ